MLRGRMHPGLLAITGGMIPVPPLEQPHARPHDGDDPSGDQTDTHGSVGVAVQRLPRIVRVAFQPDVIERHDL